MQVALLNTKPYDCSFLPPAAGNHEFVFFEPRISSEARELAAGSPVMCVIVDDISDVTVLKQLTDQRAKLIVLCFAGFNNIDWAAARELFGYRGKTSEIIAIRVMMRNRE